MKKVLRWLKRTCVGLTFAIIVSIPASVWLWHDRDAIRDIDLPAPEPVRTGVSAVTATWLGVTTLLFDDGETQILIDGFFSRPGILDIVFHRPIVSDAVNIDYALNAFRMRRLAAIIPLHSHYDHAMDVGAVANRCSASVIGTESTANIARGAGVPDDQIILATNGDALQFGKFTVTLITSRHVPNSIGDNHILGGFMTEPLRQPATFDQWREGGSWSVLISHPDGTTLVQGSAGFIDSALAAVQADVVMLSVAGLHRQGYEYAKEYWRQVVRGTGARRVYLIHHDDFTQPFGVTMLFPTVLDDVVGTVQWLKEFAATGEAKTEIMVPAFGEPVALY